MWWKRIWRTSTAKIVGHFKAKGTLLFPLSRPVRLRSANLSVFPLFLFQTVKFAGLIWPRFCICIMPCFTLKLKPVSSGNSDHASQAITQSTSGMYLSMYNVFISLYHVCTHYCPPPFFKTVPCVGVGNPLGTQWSRSYPTDYPPIPGSGGVS